MQHSFDVELAKEYGILEAILMQNIYFWIEKNIANKKHFYDDRYWTYNSRKAFSEMFPYASEKQIRRALEKLENLNILITGNYNKQWSDRTLWYSFSDIGLSIVQKRQMQLSKKTNDKCPNGQMANAQEGKAIPYINTDNKPDNKQENIKENENKSTPEKESEKEKFNSDLVNKFWNVYPKKKSKGNVEKWFVKNKPSEDLVNEMITKINLLKETKQWKSDNGQYIPYPTTWLNAKGWEDEIQPAAKHEQHETREEECISERARRIFGSD